MSSLYRFFMRGSRQAFRKQSGQRRVQVPRLEALEDRELLTLGLDWATIGPRPILSSAQPYARMNAVPTRRTKTSCTSPAA